MGKYADFNAPEWRERIDAANRVSIAEYCQRYGIPIVRCGGGWRHKEYDSLKITENKWRRFSGQTGAAGKWSKGYTVAFVMEYSGVSMFEALKRLLDMEYPDMLPLPGKTLSGVPEKGYEKLRCRIERVNNAGSQVGTEEAEADKEPFTLPKKAAHNNDIFEYLTEKRKIAPDIIVRLLEEGTLYQDVRKNCVFCRKDNEGNWAYAFLRGTYRKTDGTYFRGEQEGSDKAWAWAFTPDEAAQIIYVYESPIDLLSHITLNRKRGVAWEQAHYLSLGGCEGYAALENYLKIYPDISQIVFCLDNDKGGNRCTEKYMDMLSKDYLCARAQPPELIKDWNDCLLKTIEAEMI